MIRKTTFNWKELCLFFGQKSCKNDRSLINISIFAFCSTLEKRAAERNDTEMNLRVSYYRKLIANEAKYRKCCHVKYIKQDVKLGEERGIDSVYDTALYSIS